MSLILDALNRSRTEQDEVPTLVTRHEYADGGRPGRSPGLVVALLLALSVIAWLLWDRVGLSDPAAVAPVDEPVVAAGVEATQPAVTRALPVPEAAMAKPVPAPVAPEASPGEKLPAEAPAEIRPAARGNSSEDVSSLYRQPPDASVQAEPAAPSPAAAAESGTIVEETGVDIGTLVHRAEDELENARLAEHPAPFITELSQQTKDAIPSIFYQRHDFSGRPGQSVVVLNGKELKVGGSPASGVKVEEILPDSVVLDYRGTEFRLRALNSWVNL
ncbi:general secretion pathway protein GspB [Seongchinamella unica]|uniref:general secretion pathway protein GspB n=1 Tax=Seongchinamella unica TaxID=2547392 RepID=UPI0014052FAD|nr:general secretion pathway protein GspB [Seongchinamella unica]